MRKLWKFFGDCLPTRNERFLWLIVSAITIAIVSVNALSILTEAERSGADISPLEPWVDEGTSALFTILLFPIVGWFVRRLPIDAKSLKQTLISHFGLSILFSAIHIGGMVLARKIIYGAFASRSYTFFDVFWRDAIYEYRKDVVTYAMFAATLYLVRALTMREEALAAAAPSQPKRLAFKSGGQAIWIDADAFSYAKAAGNYVEIYAGADTHLVRLSLAKLEDMLVDAGIEVARIHRSYIVKAAEIVAVKPTGDGDAEVSLKGGITLPASRRYRDRLAAVH